MVKGVLEEAEVASNPQFTSTWKTVLLNLNYILAGKDRKIQRQST
jgi:hypothetical protein